MTQRFDVIGVYHHKVVLHLPVHEHLFDQSKGMLRIEPEKVVQLQAKKG
jgi:hypothetical protein